MITINPFWSHSLRLYAKPKFGSCTLQDLYQAQAFLPLHFSRSSLSDCQMCTSNHMTKGHWCQLLYLCRHPNISLMCNPCHLCLLASPHYLMWSFDTNDKRSHGSMSAISPHFSFFLRMIPTTLLGSQKGPHPKRWKFVLWRANHSLSSPLLPHVQNLDSRQLLIVRLRKICIPLPLAATCRSFGDTFLAISNIHSAEYLRKIWLSKIVVRAQIFITRSL